MPDRSEAELRARIEATRVRMGETIEEIGERVNPDRVKAELRAHARDQVDEIKENVKEKARSTMREVKHEVRDTGRGIWDTIRENPIPAGMVGIGLAWLIANRSDSHEYETRRYGYGYGYDYERGERSHRMGPAVPYTPGMDRDYAGMDDRDRYAAGSYSAGTPHDESHGVRGAMDAAQSKARDGAETIRDTVGDAVDTARDAAGDAVDTVREAAGDAVHAVRDAASDVVDRAAHGIDRAQDQVSEWAGDARRGAMRVERRVEYAARENPLAAGAVALAAGLVAGLMIPETRREHQLMGETRDRVFDRAGEMAQKAGEKVREVAEEAGDVVRDAVDDAVPDDTRSGADAFRQPRG
jgi:ElaB/YqjD/DUF883 family membrane-anchored ribosome-binding protein